MPKIYQFFLEICDYSKNNILKLKFVIKKFSFSKNFPFIKSTIMSKKKKKIIM